MVLTKSRQLAFKIVRLNEKNTVFMTFIVTDDMLLDICNKTIFMYLSDNSEGP